ncbi:agmatinase [Aliikangiella coralliicola]|uniref:Agmatinase n=1 Tax=Aliikangiella coralliicola TaxID=2592383 RepID=A0A545UB17_9GAMM|nr:agmatinase [Aliikangiella coralliicola]TQV86655.1 agmatinase [Aliikangiella coralliicola]
MAVDQSKHSYQDLESGDVALIGVCSDANSSYLRGPAKAPKKIREALYCGSANLSSELGVTLGNNAQFKDLGDQTIEESVDDFLNITQLLSPVLSKGAKPLTLGGDHAVTYPVLKAVAEKHGPVNLLHFDAHPDLYHEFEGNQYSHACPFARIMEQGLAKRLVQVGIRTLNEHQKTQAEKYSVEIHEMSRFDVSHFKPDFDGPVYISFDMDALDPAYAPGVSHHEPGGLSVRDVLTVIQAVDVPVIGADIVEYNPTRDVNDMTAMVAAKLLKELAGKMLS